MINTNAALELILKDLKPTMEEAGFRALAKENDAAVFENDSSRLQIALRDDRAVLGVSPREGEPFKELSVSLLELGSATERDCKYIADDFAEEVRRKFCKRSAGQPLAPGKKPPKSVSKTAIRNGDAYYDALSFGNSFTALYPELRGEYKANYERYGEFLPEEFFQAVGNRVVLKTIRRNDKVQMRRLFNLLNEVYENGVNEVQSLVAVTILGALENDEILLARCTDYMSRDLAPVVIRVNQYLAKSVGARKKLENPPLYKPKKEKKPGFFQQLMSGGGEGGFPGM